MHKFFITSVVSLGIGAAALSGAGVAAASGDGDGNGGTECCPTTSINHSNVNYGKKAAKVTVKQSNWTSGKTNANTSGKKALGGVTQSNGNVSVSISQ